MSIPQSIGNESNADDDFFNMEEFNLDEFDDLNLSQDEKSEKDSSE